MLRCMLKGGSDWVSVLPLAELFYNSSVNVSTHLSPFECVYGHAPNLPFKMLLPSVASAVPAAGDFLDHMAEVWGSVAENL